MKIDITNQPRSQQGAVLAIALIMLVLITLLAVGASRSTRMEERMASNSRNDNIAFQLAETTLRYAEKELADDIDSRSIVAARSQTIGLGACEIVLNSLDFDDAATWPGTSCPYVGTADDAASEPPRYYIEFLHAESAVMVGGAVAASVECFYRITTQGYGPDVNSEVTLQTTYRFDDCS